MKIDISEMIESLNNDNDVSMSRTKNGKYYIFVTGSETMADQLAKTATGEIEIVKPTNKEE